MPNPEDIVDPELVERLAAWFGTGQEVVTTAQAFTPAPTPDPHLAELEAVIDPELVERLERLARDASDLLTFSAAIDSSVDLSLAKLEVPPPPDRNAEDPEYWQPNDIRAALAEHNTPQAVLRDLFRPIMYFGDVVLHPIETGLERLGEDPTAEVRAAVRQPATPGLDPLSAELIAADLGELREIMARPWADSKPENPSQPSIMPDYEHYMWFGVEGGYDPDV